MWFRSVAVAALALLLAVGASQQPAAQSAFADLLTHPAIHYAPSGADPIARLQDRIAKGALRLDASQPAAYLRSLLAALQVSERSQMLVFSKTSLQSARIDRTNPRALYFNDTVAVGYVPGGFIEIAAQDPDQGVQFYMIDPKVSAPAIGRRTGECLFCHHSYRTEGIAGMIEPMTHQRPLERRWGGWFVTGNLGPVRHLGNADLMANAQESDFNWPSLEGRLQTAKYLTPYSDAVALLVFEHQMHMMNLFTKANWDARLAAAEPSSDAKATLDDDIAAIVDYMLFVDEARLPAPVTGTSGFAEEFAKQGKRDARGRSLRDLDLRTRLMKFPCSYLIDSEQFDHLPAVVKTGVYTQLGSILSGVNAASKYQRFSRADRQAIVEILHATKPDLPPAFGRKPS